MTCARKSSSLYSTYAMLSEHHPCSVIKTHAPKPSPPHIVLLIDAAKLKRRRINQALSRNQTIIWMNYCCANSGLQWPKPISHSSTSLCAPASTPHSNGAAHCGSMDWGHMWRGVPLFMVLPSHIFCGLSRTVVRDIIPLVGPGGCRSQMISWKPDIKRGTFRDHELHCTFD